MTFRTTHAPAFIALAIASTTALGCNTRSESTEIADTFGDPDLSPDEWDLAPVNMAVESTYTLRAPAGFFIRSADTPDTSITANISADEQSVSIMSMGPIAGQLMLELERSGVTYEGIPVDIEVMEPDAIALEGQGTEHVFLGEAFSIGYTLEAEGELLVGHGFQPFDAPEGVSIAAIVGAESTGLLNSVQRRELSFEVDPETGAFELVAKRGGQDHTFTRASQDMEVALTFHADENDNTRQVSPDRIEASISGLVLRVSAQTGEYPVYGGNATLQTTDADCLNADLEDAVDGVFTHSTFALGSRTILLSNVAVGETLTCEYEVRVSELPESRQTLVVEYSPKGEQGGED